MVKYLSIKLERGVLVVEAVGENKDIASNSIKISSPMETSMLLCCVIKKAFLGSENELKEAIEDLM